MELKEIMALSRFAVLGDTLNPEKYAYKIKHALLEKGYTVYPVGKELASLNDIPDDIDVIDLCIHPTKGLKLLQECKKSPSAACSSSLVPQTRPCWPTSRSTTFPTWTTAPWWASGCIPEISETS